MESGFKILGLMSGTSLDGLDIAICSFQEVNSKWTYQISYAETISYPLVWKTRLAESHTLDGEKLIKLDHDYGTYLGQAINSILKKTGEKPSLISSHGHTVFHYPSNGYTLQIGHGSNITAHTNLPVVCDFRSTDIALGGQGAPLVPIGDKILFSEYDGCLNLGGFANISFDLEEIRRACDICPTNIILNRYAELEGLNYDKDGMLGRKGKLHKTLLDKLSAIPYYSKDFPKSLSREWLEEIFIPTLEGVPCSDADKLHTIYDHIARQITAMIEKYSIKKVMVTGGGAYNKYLMELIKYYSSSEMILPDQLIIEFKEAIVFAFLGLLKYLNKINCLSSVTGASRDSSSGALYT